MKISQKGLYALQAMMTLARRYNQGAIRIRDIAYEENLPEKFLELILLELKNARIVESVRGAKGGIVAPVADEIRLSEIIRLIDGPSRALWRCRTIARLIDRDLRAQRFIQGISRSKRCGRQDSENTTLADLVDRSLARDVRRQVCQKTSRKKKTEPRVLSIRRQQARAMPNEASSLPFFCL